MALRLAAAGTCTSPQYGKARKAWQHVGHCADLRHLRLTLDTTEIVHRAQHRGSWNGPCERQIDGLARFGIRRHLR